MDKSRDSIGLRNAIKKDLRLDRERKIRVVGLDISARLKKMGFDTNLNRFFLRLSFISFKIYA